MTCSNKGCKIKSRINPKTGLCPSCDDFFRGVNRRVQTLDRRHQARDQSRGAHRDLGNQDDDIHCPPLPDNNVFNFPNPSSAQIPLPNIDLNDIIKNCEAAKNGAQVDTGKVLGDMMGMIVHMFAKQSENEVVKEQVDSNTDRISHLEAKVGDANDVAFPRSIAIRKLPLPPQGVSELENAIHYMKEVKAEGFDAQRDCIKAIRKESMKHNPNLGPNLGTVLVELKSEDARGKLMKSKKNLTTHPAPVLRNLVIRNAMTPAEMKAQNTHFGILKMITGSNNFYIAGNGAIKQKDPQYIQNETAGRHSFNNDSNQHQQNNLTHKTQQVRPQANQNQHQPPQAPQGSPQPKAGPSLSHPQSRIPQQIQNRPQFPSQMYQQGRPVFQSHIPPLFPQFQYPAFMPPAPVQAKPSETAAAPVVNLLDFEYEFAPVQSAPEPRPSSARSDHSDQPGLSHGAQHQENAQRQ